MASKASQNAPSRGVRDKKAADPSVVQKMTARQVTTSNSTASTSTVKVLKSTAGPSILSAKSSHSASTRSGPAQSSSHRLQASSALRKTKTDLQPPPGRTNKKSPSPTSSSLKDSAAPPPLEHVPTQTSDPLQVASHLYSWKYMASALQSCFDEAEIAAREVLESRAAELSEEETAFADRRILLEAKRLITFYDELALPQFSRSIPSIIQGFLHHGETSAQLANEALQLASRNVSQIGYVAPIKSYNDTLIRIGDAREQGIRIEASIHELVGAHQVHEVHTTDNSGSGHDQIVAALFACLRVLRARNDNLAQARELVEFAKDNISMSLQLESMRLIS